GMAAQHDRAQFRAAAGNGSDQIAGGVDGGDCAGRLHGLVEPGPSLQGYRGEGASGPGPAGLGDGCQRLDIVADPVGADGGIPGHVSRSAASAASLGAHEPPAAGSGYFGAVEDLPAAQIGETDGPGQFDAVIRGPADDVV